jgi:hypothetical protein
MEGDTARVTYRRLWLKIEFGVPNAGTCAHHLNVAGNNTSGVPQAIAMGHCTFADISNDFRVRVSMWGETAVRRDFIIVPEARRTPTRNLRPLGRNGAWLGASYADHLKASERADVLSRHSPRALPGKLAPTLQPENRDL